MDNFSYLSVLISIVLGLGMTQLLSGFGRWVENRSAFPAYAPTIIWSAVLLLIHIQTWWSMYGLRFHANWTFFQFFVVLLQPIVLFLLSSLVLPSTASSVGDLRQNYESQRKWFFGLLSVLLLVSVARDAVLTSSLPSRYNIGFHLMFLSTFIVGMVFSRESVHRVIATFTAVAICLYIVLLFYALE